MVNRNIDRMFDRIVAEERNPGVMIDLCTHPHPVATLLVGDDILEASDHYKFAMHSRIMRLVNMQPGRETLVWVDRSFAFYTKPTTSGSRRALAIEMTMPITENKMCDCGCEKRDKECLTFRKELKMWLVFDFVLKPETPLTIYLWAFEQVTRDVKLSREDAHALTEALERADEMYNMGGSGLGALCPPWFWLITCAPIQALVARQFPAGTTAPAEHHSISDS